MTGYTRQSTYSDGDTILAADSNNEFDAIEITMAAGTGHAHDNNAGQGAFVPLISNVANSRKVEVTASGAKTTGDHQVTGQIISDSGPITATLGNIVATAGSIDATAGAVTAGTTVTGATGVIATTGGVTATAGGVTASAGDITATLGNIDATAGSVSAGTTVTAGTGATVTSGNLAVSSGNITVSGTVDGRDISVDGTKLDTIETNAKDDQTAAEVVSTPAGNLIATDVQAALNELDTEKAALAGAAFTGAITTTSTFDGRDVSVDGTKLDGIETAATADQTAADIRTLGFFDITNDGTGSGLDADTVDGIEGSALADTSLSNLTATGKDKITSAWVNFDGTGTVAIRDQLNVTSITDNGTGDYTVNFTTTMSNIDYSILGGCDGFPTARSGAICFNIVSSSGAFEAPTTSGFRLSATTGHDNVARDLAHIYVNTFGGI